MAPHARHIFDRFGKIVPPIRIKFHSVLAPNVLSSIDRYYGNSDGIALSYTDDE
jgi:hypothetical protein